MAITRVIVSVKNREYLTKRAGSYHKMRKKVVSGNECREIHNAKKSGQWVMKQKHQCFVYMVFQEKEREKTVKKCRKVTENRGECGEKMYEKPAFFRTKTGMKNR